MTGPEHYREAERHLNVIADAESRDEVMGHIAMAQAHAALALVQATLHGGIFAAGDEPFYPEGKPAWSAVIK